jgi:hypothetical protein
MVGRTPPPGLIQAAEANRFISHGENARRIRRLPALSGALRAERTPQFARNFRHLQNVGKLACTPIFCRYK